jgi:hypothetical protein
LVADNASDGIEITTITNSPISILCFQGARMFSTVFVTNLVSGTSRTITNYNSIAQQVSLYFI